MRSEGYSVLVVTPDPLELEARQLAAEKGVSGLPVNEQFMSPLAAQLAYVERRLLLSRLRSLGVVVVEWPEEKTLEQAMAGQDIRQARVGR
jgi:hypothetical protein